MLLPQSFPLVLAKEHCASCGCRQNPSAQQRPCLHLVPHCQLLGGHLLRNHTTKATSVCIIVGPELITHLHTQSRGQVQRQSR
jgi:hypothetical protein